MEEKEGAREELTHKLDVRTPGLLIINGAAQEGKSHLIRYIMHEKMKKFSYGIVFTQTSHNPKNFDYIPERFKHQGYKPDVLEALLEHQKKNMDKMAFVIFDDCISSESQWRSEVLVQACTQWAQFNLFIILSTQYARKIPPSIRENVSAAVIFYTKGKNTKVALYEAYGGDYESVKDFQTKLLSLLESRSNKFVYWCSYQTMAGWRLFKAPAVIPKFKFNFDVDRAAKVKRKNKNKKNREENGAGQGQSAERQRTFE